MNTSTIIGAVAAAAAVVAGSILYLQSFDAEKVACADIAGARASLQASYGAGVDASVEVFAGERAQAEEALSRCINAKPVDPCADLQAARDAAVANYNGIKSPPDSAPYEEFQVYFQKREEAYQAYKAARDALAACRAANPPKGDVPYEKSDTKACFDAYDASMASTQSTFTSNTQTLRSALAAALAALDAREKACNPPTGKDKFTDPPVGKVGQDGVAVEIRSCKMIDPTLDLELFVLQRKAAAMPAQIQSVQDTIDSARKRMSPLNRDLSEVDTWIPPEVTKTQFEGAINALRAERKVSIESSLDYYKKLIERKQAEKAELEAELADLQAQIAARQEQIRKENEARQRAFPTSLHMSKPDKCEYFHCHGTMCGKADPAPNGCGQGSTVPTDTECKEFFNSYLEATGVK